MTAGFDIWKMLAGIAVFLLGMRTMEDSLRQLAGRPFKLFLRKQSGNKAKAIAGGAVVTAILQSSSVVNLILLAFTGAGIITMSNTLAVMLGANLGTTFTSWLVVLIGFKLNLESISLALTGLAGLAVLFSRKGTRWLAWSRFLLGLGLLFVGLDFIKTGVESFVMGVNLAEFNRYPLVIFVVVGFVMTTLIQSSSVAVAISLSALHVGAIDLIHAMCVVLGAEIGTTVKVVIAAMGGSLAKKRVAWGNFTFNAITTILVFLFLQPTRKLVSMVISGNDPLWSLVFFQTLVNIISILVFFPLLSPLARLLERWIRSEPYDFILLHRQPVLEAEAALEQMKQETRIYLMHVIDFGLSIFGIRPDGIIRTESVYPEIASKPIDKKYDFLKQQHGEFLDHYLRSLQLPDSEKEHKEMERTMSAVRNGMYAAKNLKDAIPDTQQLFNSSNDVKYSHYLETRGSMLAFFKTVADWLQQKEPVQSEEILSCFTGVQQRYSNSLKILYEEGLRDSISEVEISTILNFNREQITACKSLIMACKDYLLAPEEARKLEELPGFIR